MPRIAPEGRPFIIMGLVVATVLAALGWGVAWGGGARTLLLNGAGAAAILTLFILYFFRDPPRTPPADEDAVVAPADGRIVQISTVDEPSFMGRGVTRISIFLSIFNVHLQRAPISGSVKHRSYRPGGFAAAWAEKASEENEQASVGIEAGPWRVLVRQIAGLVARRVVTDPREGDTIRRGERIGIIRFGSRVDLFLPPEWKVVCRKGGRAVGGETVLARIPLAGGAEGEEP